MEQPQNIPLITIFVLGTAGMLILIIGIILFVVVYKKRIAGQALSFQKDLLKATITSENKERRRIASDLHDEIGGLLVTNRMVVAQLLDTRELPVSLFDKVKECKELLDTTIEMTRKISFELMPQTLIRFGVKEGLKELCSRNSKSGIKINFQYSSENIHLSENQSLVTYRVTQELLTNALKHSRANLIKLIVHKKEGFFILTVSDNGVGFDHKKYSTRKEEGMGLSNIYSRLQQIGGTIEFRDAKPSGTCVKVTFPLIDNIIDKTEKREIPFN